LPIRDWQVWNEPSLPAYWPAGPDARAYVALLREVGRALRRVDPRARVVTAGIPNSRLGIPFARFIDAMYRAGAKGTFDSLAIHPYAEDERGVIAAVALTRRLMRRYGDDSPIWITEVGWASSGPASHFTVTAGGQAQRVGRLIRALAAQRTALGIRGFVYFGWRDAAPYAGTRDFWGLHTGLVDIDGRPKRSLASFAQATAALGIRARLTGGGKAQQSP
jgi:hypothetical protein